MALPWKPRYQNNATAAKFVLPIPIFLAYLVPLDVDVTGNITAKLCEVWSEFNIFCIKKRHQISIYKQFSG
jgi:hypothetical protein